jgi:hypothetical protein
MDSSFKAFVRLWPEELQDGGQIRRSGAIHKLLKSLSII